MKLLEILGRVGSSIIKEVVPGGGLIIEAVNAFLPDDKKLDTKSTGSDISNAVASLPPEAQAQLLNKKFDIEITQIKESYDTVRAMLDSDAQNPQSTRPKIALGSFQLVRIVLLTVVALWAYGVASADEVLVKTVMDGWTFIAVLIGTPTTVLLAYFGVLKAEHKQRLNAATGNKEVGILGSLAKLIGK
jgi:hypothetical protein